MTRRHKSNYYSSEGLRQLQAQINELWEVVEELRPEPYASPHLRPATLPEEVGFIDGAASTAVEYNLERLAEFGPDDVAPTITCNPPWPSSEEDVKPAVMDVVDRQDATPAAAAFMDAAAHGPQPFKIIPTGNGWYQVVDIKEGKAIHEGKLRKAAAAALMQAKVNIFMQQARVEAMGKV